MKRKDANIAAYQMAAEVMNRVGIHEGNVFRYHQARRQTKNYQADLEMLQYDIFMENSMSMAEKIHIRKKSCILEWKK